MTMAEIDRRRRPRRIAADEAHAWARNLRIGNPHAKFVLCMLTGYVNGEGACFVSISHLAEDCELVENTVRRRLSFLEEIGAIARAPQWIDEVGRRNGDGRGRRTTDEIRLMINADPDEIEARASGAGEGDRGEFSPARGEGLAPAGRDASDPARGEGSNSADPALGVHLPFTCVQGLISEPEPKILPPNPPPGGVDGTEERFREFKAGYPDGIVDLIAAQESFAALSAADQKACVAGVPVFAARCLRRREKPMKAHLFIRKRVWEGLMASPAPEAGIGGPYGLASEAGRALQALARIGQTSLPRMGDGRLIYTRPITPQLLALASAPAEGAIYRIGSPNFAAWRDFLRAHLTNLRQFDAIEAPWPWPPRKDGGVSTGPPADAKTLCTAEDLAEFK